MKKLLQYSILASMFLAGSAFATCTSPTTVGGGGGGGGSGGGDFSIASTSYSASNVGFYSWNEAAQVWVLEAETWTDWAANDQPMAGDYLVPEADFYTGGGGVGGGGGGLIKLQKHNEKDGRKDADFSIATCSDDEIPTMPTVTATAPAPPSGITIGTIIITTIRNIFSPNNGGHGRQISGGVRQGDQSMSCNSDQTDRTASAYKAIPRMVPRGKYVVRFGQNDSQVFFLSEPYMTDGGIYPVTDCINR